MSHKQASTELEKELHKNKKLVSEMRSTKKSKAVKTSAKQESAAPQSADPAEPVEVSFVNEDDSIEQPVEVSRGLSSERKKGGMTERQLKRINIIVDAVREHKVWHISSAEIETRSHRHPRDQAKVSL